MDSDAAESWGPGRRLLTKRMCHFLTRAQTCGQRIGDIGERKSWSAGNHKLTLVKQRLGLAPHGNICERVDANQQKKAVSFLEGLLEMLDGIDSEVRLSRPHHFFARLPIFRRFQK